MQPERQQRGLVGWSAAHRSSPAVSGARPKLYGSASAWRPPHRPKRLSVRILPSFSIYPPQNSFFFCLSLSPLPSLSLSLSLSLSPYPRFVSRLFVLVFQVVFFRHRLCIAHLLARVLALLFLVNPVQSNRTL